MARQREIRLTDRQLEVMQVLWDLGSGTVAEVQEALADELAYTTALTILRMLEIERMRRLLEEGGE